MRRYLFADEAGDTVFVRNARNSRYFIICTVTMDSCEVGAALLDLRRQLAWEGTDLGPYFHASEDRQAVRNRVFPVIARFPFQIQATVMEKSKAQDQVRTTKQRFYQYGWLYHARYGIKPQLKRDDEILITTASISTKKEQAAFTAGVNDVFQQTVPRERWKTYFCKCESDPCLQLTDYCAWAIQKKWERNDSRSYDLIRDRITYEYELWRKGQVHYY